MAFASYQSSLTIALLLASPFFQVALGKRFCYYPDGALASDDVACDPNENDASFCCGPGYSCLENGLCASGLGDPSQVQYIRGSCTDDTFLSEACPRYCIQNATAPGGDQGNADGGINMYPCNSNNTWICYGRSCATDSFPLTGNIVAFTTIYSAGQSPTSTLPVASTAIITVTAPATDNTATATSTSSITAAATSESASPPGLSSGAKIGLGIGVALGTLLLAVLGAMLWYILQLKKKAKSADANGNGNGRVNAGYPELHGQKSPLASNYSTQASGHSMRTAYRDPPIELPGYKPQ